MIAISPTRWFALLLPLLSACAPQRASQKVAMPPSLLAPWDTIALVDGKSVIRRMRARYDARFPTTITFRQENTLYPVSGGEQRSEWLEYAAIPGRLRVEYMPATARSGTLYANQRIHVFEGGRMTRSDPYTHPLMVLLYDVHALPADSTIVLLTTLKFDLTTLREDTWSGRRVFVVGATQGDTSTNQFWIDAERLVTVRVIQTDKRGGRSILNETRLDNFVEHGGAPIATEILFVRDGRPYFREVYQDVRVNMPLAPELFDPQQWSTTGSFGR